MTKAKEKKEKLILHKELKNKTILITGGAGSIGSALAKKILEFPVNSVRILDIDEHALFRLNRSISNSRLRLLLGNVLDNQRLEMAGHQADIIIHAAAVKNIEISEFNPIETIDVNVNGTINMVKMCMKNEPKKFLNISTDKAVEASTLYGTTKLLSEKLISWAGAHINETKFASARFGNVIETKGNVFEIWNEELQNHKPISITNPSMRRYFFHVTDAVSFILNCITQMNEGEVFVPKMKLYNISKMASKFSKNIKIIGVRQGEKINEVLISNYEKKRAIEKENMWIIKPYLSRGKKLKRSRR